MTKTRRLSKKKTVPCSHGAVKSQVQHSNSCAGDEEMNLNCLVTCNRLSSKNVFKKGIM